MIRASVSYTKNHLSALLNQVKEGETILVTDRDRPIARIVPMEQLNWDDHLLDLERRGMVNLPEGPPVDPSAIVPIVPIVPASGFVGLVDAVSEERSEGR